MDRRAFIAGSAVALVTLAEGAQAAGALKKITITSVGDGFHFFPVYIARGAGFFAEEGLEVDWVNVNSGTRQAASVMGGSAEMSPIALLHCIKSQAEGADLVAFASALMDWPMTLVLSNDAMKKTGIAPEMPLDEKVKRLAGLQLGITSPGSSSDVSIRTLLLARGIDPDRAVKLQPLGNGASILAAFEKKLTDGFVFAAPAPEIVEARGLGRIVVNPLAGEIPEQVDVPYAIMATSRDTWAKKPDVIRGAARALTKAMTYVQEKPEETRKVMRQYFPDIDEPVFNRIVATYAKAVPKSPVITRDQVAKTIAFMNIGAAAPVTAKYEAVVLPEPAEAAARDLLKK
jgi:NitT/TauT family transport system substrate-binding protein